MNPAPVSPFLSPHWRDEKAFRRSTRHSFSGRSSHFGTAGRFVLVLLASLLLAAGCDNNGPVQPQGPTITNLPSRFRLTGTASGSNANQRTASCSLDLIFELRTEVARSPELVEYTGVHGGEVARAVLAKNGSGFSFFAQVFGDVEARLHTLGRVELLIPVNVDAEGRFWQNLARFDGAVTEDDRGSGRWTCAPFDLNSGGYRDVSLVVQGTWTFKPEP